MITLLHRHLQDVKDLVTIMMNDPDIASFKVQKVRTVGIQGISGHRVTVVYAAAESLEEISEDSAFGKHLATLPGEWNEIKK